MSEVSFPGGMEALANFLGGLPAHVRRPARRAQARRSFVEGTEFSGPNRAQRRSNGQRGPGFVSASLSARARSQLGPL